MSLFGVKVNQLSCNWCSGSKVNYLLERVPRRKRSVVGGRLLNKSKKTLQMPLILREVQSNLFKSSWIYY